MRQSSFDLFLRRLYLAASELRPGVLVLLLAAHMAASYALLAAAGEAELMPAPAFVYWYATTASTVGYGDLSPKSDGGRLTVALFVMPGAIALFTVAIARAFAGISDRWRRRRMGLADFSRMAGHIVLVGYDADRTPRMIDEILADGAGQDIVLLATDALDNVASTHRFVRATALTNAADLARAGVAAASKVVVQAPRDAETMGATLAVTAINEAAHVVCFLRDRDTARLIEAHCPSVEVVLTPAVELLAKALSDPGSSRMIAQLASHRDEGATLYAMVASAAESFAQASDRLRGRDAVLVAVARTGEHPRFDPQAAIAPGDRLFYIARERVAA